jgi:N-methylhydantoinase B
MSIADRALLACWGVRGGRAGRPFEVTIHPGERAVDALADAEPVRAGEIIRIRTTGGGGWGDPLDRPYDEVERDVRWGKVSVAGALRDYGVVIGDEAATAAARAAARAERTGDEPFFDRGPGYPALSGGRVAAEVDLV